ncbi:hypothetical protein MRX96_031044 [Rhipicephalus microplus]
MCSPGTSARRPKEGRDPHTTPHPGHARRIMRRVCPAHSEPCCTWRWTRRLLDAPRAVAQARATPRRPSTVAHYAEKTPHMSRHNTAASTSSSLTRTVELR